MLSCSIFPSRLLCVLALLGLAACGGGGGGGGSGSPGSVSVPARAFTVTANHDSSLQASAVAHFALSGIPDEGVAILVESDSAAVADANVVETGPAQGRIELLLNSGQLVGAAVHAVRARVSFCVDEACTRHVAGSPVDIRVTYDVRPEERKVRFEHISPASATALVSDTVAPTLSGFLKVTHPPAEGLKLNAAINLGDARAFGEPRLTAVEGGYRVDVPLTSPGAMGPGEYLGTKHLMLCWGDDCVRSHELGRPSFDLAYTVTRAPIQSARQFDDLHVKDMAWDAVSSRLVLALGGAGAVSSNRVLLDPSTGAITEPQDNGIPLHCLSVSPDGQYVAAIDLSARSVLRYRMSDLSLVDRTHVGDSLQDSPDLIDLKYGPNGELAVLTSLDANRTGPSMSHDLRILDGTVVRPLAHASNYLEAMAWNEDGSTLYVADLISGLLHLDVTPQGVQSSDAGSGNGVFFGLEFVEGRLFSSRAQVLDAATGDVSYLPWQRPQDITVYDIAVHLERRQLYVLHTHVGDERDDARITSFDLDSLVQQESVLLRKLGTPVQMIRWGSQGLAVTNDAGKLRLLEGGIVSGRSS